MTRTSPAIRAIRAKDDAVHVIVAPNIARGEKTIADRPELAGSIILTPQSRFTGRLEGKPLASFTLASMTPDEIRAQGMITLIRTVSRHLEVSIRVAGIREAEAN